MFLLKNQSFFEGANAFIDTVILEIYKQNFDRMKAMLMII